MATINGTENNDVINGTNEDDEISGFGGNDFISGLLGKDRLFGGDGDDILNGGSHDDLLDGGDGNDQLLGTNGNDVLIAGNGNDQLVGGAGDDILDGGNGTDLVRFTGTLAGVTVDLNLQATAQDIGGGQGRDTFIGIEHVQGTGFDDRLIGDDGDNALMSGTPLPGRSDTGNDTISGGGGNDLIDVGPGNHLLDGGSGIDTLALFGNGSVGGDGATVSLLLQGSAQDSGQGMMTITGFENLSGSFVDDRLTGDSGDNILAGNAGTDVLVCGEGHDTLLGDGRFQITSRTSVSEPITLVEDTTAIFPALAAGDDVLDGGEGHDRLVGGNGNDTLIGGGGRDTFVFGADTDDDVIIDFEKIDLLDLSSILDVDSIDDLLIAATADDVVISWGTDASVTLADTQLKHVTADSFKFAGADETPDSVAAALAHGSSFGSGGGIELAMATISMEAMA